MIHSNVYILIPVTGTFNSTIHFDAYDKATKFSNKIQEQMLMACEKEIANTINRVPIGKIRVKIYNDDTYNDNKANIVDAGLSYTYQNNTDLGILSIQIEDLPYEDSPVGDSVFSNKLKITVDKEYENLNEFLAILNLSLCGKIRMVYINDIKNKSDENLNYLLFGESQNRGSENFGIKKDCDIIEKKNMCIYDAFEFYASEKAIVIFSNDFNCDVTNKDGFTELLYFFVIEINMLQYSAVYRINRDISNKLIDNSKGHISSKKSLTMIENFGKTIKLWDNSIYFYYFDQVLSNYLIEKFKTNELKEQYKSVSEHIQRVSDLRRNINTSIENTILNITAFVLGITQIVQIAPQMEEMLKGKIVGRTMLSLAILVFIIFVIHKNREEEL